jgi:hypothetical protein
MGEGWGEGSRVRPGQSSPTCETFHQHFQTRTSRKTPNDKKYEKSTTALALFEHLSLT